MEEVEVATTIVSAIEEDEVEVEEVILNEESISVGRTAFVHIQVPSVKHRYKDTSGWQRFVIQWEAHTQMQFGTLDNSGQK